jgi:hypothetical protein
MALAVVLLTIGGSVAIGLTALALWLLRCRDRDYGLRSGNLLDVLADLYPPEAATWLRDRPPLLSCWGYRVWQTPEGRTGYFFRFNGRLPPELRPVFDELYRGFTRDESYPELYNEGYVGGLPMAYLGDDQLSVWVLVGRRGRESSKRTEGRSSRCT